MTPGAKFTIQLPSGEFAELIPGVHLSTHLGPIPLPTTPDGRPFDVFYLDITNADGFKIAGQAASEIAGTWEWSTATGKWRHVSPEAPDVYPVIYDRHGQLRIAGPGQQGWRYVDQRNELVSGDDTLNAPRWNESPREPKVTPPLWEFSYLGGVFIGQGIGGCDVLIDGERRRLLDGDTRNIRVKYDGTRWGVGLTRLRERDGWRWVLTRDDLLALPLVSEAPPIPVPPVPPETPMLPDLSKFYDLLEARWNAAPIDTMTEEARASLFHRAVGEYHYAGHPEFGLLVQMPGRSHVDGFSKDWLTVRASDGTLYSGDVIHNIDGTDASVVRNGLAPEPRQDAFGVPPRPIPQPQPPIPQPPVPQPPPSGELAARVAALEVRLAKLEGAGLVALYRP